MSFLHKLVFPSLLFFSFLFLFSCSDNKNYVIEGYPIGRVTVIKSDMQWNEEGVTVFGESISFHGRSPQSQNSSSPFYNTYASFFPLFDAKKNVHFFSFLSKPKTSPLFSFTQRQTQNQRTDIVGQGTGFLIKLNDKVHLITNFHVACCFDQREDISFDFYNSHLPLLKLQVKKVTALSAKEDLAVLELLSPPSFDENIQLLPIEYEEFSNKKVEIRGFPSSKESLLLASIPHFSSQTLNNSEREREPCLQLEDTDIEDYRGVSGSPVFLRGRKSVVGVVWGATPPTEEIPRFFFSAISSKKLLNLINSDFACEGWTNCFIKAFQDLRDSYNNQGDPFAARMIYTLAGCSTSESEKPSHCSHSFFQDPESSVKTLLDNHGVLCLHQTTN